MAHIQSYNCAPTCIPSCQQTTGNLRSQHLNLALNKMLNFDAFFFLTNLSDSLVGWHTQLPSSQEMYKHAHLISSNTLQPTPCNSASGEAARVNVEKVERVPCKTGWSLRTKCRPCLCTDTWEGKMTCVCVCVCLCVCVCAWRPNECTLALNCSQQKQEWGRNGADSITLPLQPLDWLDLLTLACCPYSWCWKMLWELAGRQACSNCCKALI